MPISEDLNFDKRAIYYWVKLVTEQLSEGMMFKELKKTFSINILDFNFVPYTDAFVTPGEDDQLHDIFELHYYDEEERRIYEVRTPAMIEVKSNCPSGRKGSSTRRTPSTLGDCKKLIRGVRYRNDCFENRT